MDSHDGESRPYTESGRNAAANVNAPVRASFASILRPDALAARATEVRSRGRAQMWWGGAGALACLCLAIALAVAAARVFDGTLKTLAATTWLIVGTTVALGAAYIGLMIATQGRRLGQTSRKLALRAEQQRSKP